MGTIFREDKEKIIKSLLPILQITNNGQDIIDIQYQKLEHGEYATVKYKNGYKKSADITASGGTALIGDIMVQIFHYH